ncbi:MAG TPA: AAA family ATPase [Candidatus Thalassarchaeaceae archaeon]|nr:AAA family ATPase [Candidatus Thalassarchaeaceae archaeon]
MLKVTISGPPGSGTSTLVSRIEISRGWKSLNGGDIFREEAKLRGISVERLSSEAKGDPEIDRKLDSLLKKRISSSDSPEIVESRLSGWWAHEMGLDCLKVWVAVSNEERAKRIQKREGGDFGDCLARSQSRQQDDKDRYLTLYGIDLDDLKPYNLVIDADEKDEEEVFSIVSSRLGGRSDE